MARWFLMIVMWLAAPGANVASQPVTADQHAAQEGRFLAFVRQITFDGRCGEGYFSPDQKRIIFQSIRDGFPFYQIYIKDLATGLERRVSTGNGRTTCAFFHPSQARIIYASSHLDPNRDQVLQQERQRLEQLKRNPAARKYEWVFDSHMDIFEADSDGKNLRRLTRAHGYDAEGAYSPDGTTIVFCSFRTGEGDIYLMSADGSGVHRLTDSPGYEGGAFLSPDGKRIIYRGEVPKQPGLLQIFVMNADGTGKRQLTDNDAVNFGPYWHPDGRRVIYSTSLHGHHNYELYLLDIETGRNERVTYTPGADVLPVFSPDGRKLLWTSKRGRDRSGRITSELFMAEWVHAAGE